MVKTHQTTLSTIIKNMVDDRQKTWSIIINTMVNNHQKHGLTSSKTWSNIQKHGQQWSNKLVTNTLKHIVKHHQQTLSKIIKIEGCWFYMFCFNPQYLQNPFATFPFTDVQALALVIIVSPLVAVLMLSFTDRDNKRGRGDGGV
jgi:hypothetical protein